MLGPMLMNVSTQEEHPPTHSPRPLNPKLQQSLTQPLQPPDPTVLQPHTQPLRPHTQPPGPDILQPPSPDVQQSLTQPVTSETGPEQSFTEPLLPAAAEAKLSDDSSEASFEATAESPDSPQNVEVADSGSGHSVLESLGPEGGLPPFTSVEEMDSGGSIMVGEEALEMAPQLPELLEVVGDSTEVPLSPVLPTSMETIVAVQEREEEGEQMEEVVVAVGEKDEEGSSSEESTQGEEASFTTEPLADLTTTLTPQVSVESEGDVPSVDSASLGVRESDHARTEGEAEHVGMAHWQY